MSLPSGYELVRCCVPSGVVVIAGKTQDDATWCWVASTPSGTPVLAGAISGADELPGVLQRAEVELSRALQRRLGDEAAH